MHTRQILLITTTVLALTLALLHSPPQPTQSATVLTGNITVVDSNGTPLPVVITSHGQSERSAQVSWITSAPYISIKLDALESKGVGAEFQITSNSPTATVVLENYSFNPEVSTPPGIPIKYVNISAFGLNYNTVDIQIHYTDAEIDGLNENQLEIYHYKNRAWNRLNTNVDAVNNILSTTVDSLSTFAVAVSPTDWNIIVVDSTDSHINSTIDIYENQSLVRLNTKVKELNTHRTASHSVSKVASKIDVSSAKNISLELRNVSVQGRGKIILEDYGKNNPVSVAPVGVPVKYLEISVDNITYSSAEITIQYSDAELKGANENNLRIYHWNGKTWEALAATVDAANNTLVAETSSLSTFAASDASVFDFSISPTSVVNNTETRFTLATTNTDSNDMVNVTINCTLPAEWSINASSISDGGTLSGNTITWDGGVSIPSNTQVNRYFNATATAAGNYNFTCNGTGNATAHQLQNWDFSSGSGTDAEYWVESATGDATTQWDSTSKNMYMYLSGSQQSGDGYCNQSFTYSGPTPPTSAILNFSWYFNQYNSGHAIFYVYLKDPSGNTSTVWSYSTGTSDVAWTDESIDVAGNITTTGTYTLSLHTDLATTMGGSSYARARWDNASIVITNSYANEENLTVSIPVAASITETTTNKTGYSSNETVAINTTVNNTGGDDVTGNLTVSIRYLNGTILTTAASYPDMLIPYGESNSTTTLWNTTTTPAGNYLAYAEFNYTNQTGAAVSTTNQTTFTIAGDLNVTVDADGPYNLEDNLRVNITGMVNDSAGTGVAGATVNITLYDPDNTWVNSTETATDAGGAYQASLVIPSPLLGAYTADARASNSTLEGVGFDTFKIRQLSVTASPDKDTYAPAESMTIGGVVTDAETGDYVQGADVTVTLYNSTWAQVDTKSTTTSSDGSYTAAFVAPQSEGAYHANISATKSGITGSAQTQFNVSSVTSMSVYPSTDRAVYLLDPYRWVYEAPYAGTGAVTEFEGGHGQNVTLDMMVLNQQGDPVPGAAVTYSVANSSGVQITGTANETARAGFYRDVFVVNETIIGAEDATVTVTATYGTVTVEGTLVFHVHRWGCDSCHKPTTSGSHAGYWTDVIGSSTKSGGAVLYANLSNASLTHKTASTYYSTHEDLYNPGGGGCSGCHTGVDSVTCTQCHTNYLLGMHSNVAAGTAPSTSCSNTTCHGHLTDASVPGNVDNRYPNCSDCHPISYLDGSITTPQWFKDNNATRNPAVHPGGLNVNETVNCSFCHSTFHRIQNETWTLDNRNCTFCHTNAGVFTNHSYDNVTCAGCHQFSENSSKWHTWYGSTSKLDYHNITKPSCLTCHLGYENHSSYQTSGISCLQCHNNKPLYSYEGSVLRSGATFATGTSIHSIYNDTSTGSLIPSCTKCHDTGYANHSSYNTTGVYCTYCHDNQTLNYSGIILPANTTYNTNTAIHTQSAAEMKPGCASCHPDKNNHTTYNTTGVTCAQCHNNATLNYAGSKLYTGSYNTGTTIHTTNTTPASSNTLSPLCTTCHTKTTDEIETGYANYAIGDNPENLAPAGSNMTHKRDTITDDDNPSANQDKPSMRNYDPPDADDLYARHAHPGYAGGYTGATGTARDPNQVCINCHSDIIRDVGEHHESVWSDGSCKPCHSLWTTKESVFHPQTFQPHYQPQVLPDAHNLSIPHCPDCHMALTGWEHQGCSCHTTWTSNDHEGWASWLDPPKNYLRTPRIGLMLNDSVHRRMILNTTSGHPTNEKGCLVCHTNVSFTIDYTANPISITITSHSGAHIWNSKPECTKCHSINTSVERPGPYPNAHDLLNLEWGNNTQCLKCHNIYNQTAGRYHGHNVTTTTCTSCHFNYSAMNNYGRASAYVNQTMYSASVHGTSPGTNCTKCHTAGHPPARSRWRACEDCHVVQGNPISEHDRHNITSKPYDNLVNGTSAVDITDCTVCHDAGLYQNATSTYAGNKTHDCNYCHTYPDSTYY